LYPPAPTLGLEEMKNSTVIVSTYHGLFPFAECLGSEQSLALSEKLDKFSYRKILTHCRVWNSLLN
jgi:hypothetical protein